MTNSSSNLNLNINKLLTNIKLKKQHVKILKSKAFFLFNINEKNYKLLNSMFKFKKKILTKYDAMITYIIDISFSKSNTFLHILDFSGNVKFFYSAGSFNYLGKRKKARRLLLKEFYRVLLKLTFLKNEPLGLHLKNVGSNKFWIIKTLKNKFFIKTIRSFNVYPYNGCRKRKIRRKKFKKKRRNG